MEAAPNVRAAWPAMAARVTIVISFRERWRFTPATIDSILRHTDGQVPIWLLDPGMPDDVRAALQPRVDAGEVEIVPVDAGGQPNDARREVIGRLSSPYVLFIDNDVLVTPGWLETLVARAEQSGAGIVCPLYLWGDSERSDLIHMAGGHLELVQEGQGRRMTEGHRHLMSRLSDVEDTLRSETCGFGEYHCVLMRREVYSDPALFDPAVSTVHEHIHASLRARELGFSTWFEPEARVTYLAFAPLVAGELADFRRRWDFATAERSLAGFAENWAVNDTPAYRASTLNFVIDHVGRADLLDPRPWLGSRRDRVMTSADLQQSFGGLEYLALSSGYTVEDLEELANAYLVAMEHTNGAYRPCGRPFINHLVGTASVLLFYGCSMRHVLAGLLHALPDHPLCHHAGGWERAIEQINQIGATGRHAGRLAQLFAGRGKPMEELARSGTPFAKVPLDLASLYLLEAANDVDMHLSLEVAVSGRADVMTGNVLSTCAGLLDYVSIPGLASTLSLVREEAVQMPNVNFQGGGAGSFRFEGSRIVSASGEPHVAVPG